MHFLQRETTKKLITACFYIILGVLMCIFPSAVKIFVCYIFGGVLLLAGILRIINYYLKPKFSLHSFYVNGLTAGFLSIVVGAVLIIFNKAIFPIYPIISGAYFFLKGIGKIVRSQAYRFAKINSWWFEFVVGFVLCVLSITLIVVDVVVLESNLIVYLMGGTLIVQGIISMLTMIFLSSNMVDLQKKFNAKPSSTDQIEEDDVIDV